MERRDAVMRKAGRRMRALRPASEPTSTSVTKLTVPSASPIVCQQLGFITL